MMFKIVVVGGPCGPYIEKCLDSIVSQDDHGWTAAVVLDKHDDAPGKAMRKASEGFTVAVNHETKRGALSNIIRAILLHGPAPDDVIVTVDGDDWLYGCNVLSKVRAYYEAQPNLLLTYGSWIGYPDPNCNNNSAPYSRDEFKNGTLRKGPWRGSHLRTFKYKLWCRLKDSDLRNSSGKYYDCAWDCAFMWPMMEMAGYDRVKWISDKLYVYNRETPFNDEKMRSSEKTRNNLEITSRPAYQEVAFS